MARAARLFAVLATLVTVPGSAVAQPSPDAAGNTARSLHTPAGRIALRVGFFDGSMAAAGGDWLMDTRELALAVQPLAGRDGWERGLFVGARLGLGGHGDFSSFSRAGFDAGYVYQTPPLWRQLRIGVAAGVIADRWDIWRDEPEGQLSGTPWVVGGSARPFVRMWRFELSIPVERGAGFEAGTSFHSYGLQLGVVFF